MYKTKKSIILGTGPFGELVNFYLENDSEYTVSAFCETKPIGDMFCDKPLLSFDNIEDKYPPSEYEFFVAVGYRKMNSLRKDFCDKAKSKGYHLLSYISSKAIFWNKSNKIGKNVFVFEANTIQPFVDIDDGTILWSGNHIGHHSKIGKYCFITSHVVVSGSCEIGNQCFLGVNSTIADCVKVAELNLIGGNVLMTKNTEKNQVYSSEKGKLISHDSRRFF